MSREITGQPTGRPNVAGPDSTMRGIIGMGSGAQASSVAQQDGIIEEIASKYCDARISEQIELQGISKTMYFLDLKLT